MSWQDPQPTAGWGAPPPPPPPAPASAVPYTGSGHPGGSRQLSLRGVAIAAAILLGIAALACLVLAGALLARADTADRAVAGDLLSHQELFDRDEAVGFGSGMYALAVLATAPLVIIWQYRHAANAQRLAGPLGLGPGWAIGGWFVPLGNLALPAVQLAQAARASDPDLTPGPPGTRSRGRLPAIVVCWAVAWALGGVVAAAGMVSRPAEDVFHADAAWLEDFAAADRTSAVGMAIMAVAGVLALAMVAVLTRRQARAEATRPPWSGTDHPWAAPAGWGTPPPGAWGPTPGPWGGQAPPPPPGSAPPPPPGGWGPPG